MKKLIVWSVDALFTSDLAYAATLPGFQEMMNNSILCKNMMGIYPTLTYPCHTSILTGEYPDVHGIIHNEKLCPQTNNATWFWDYQDIKVKTIFDYCKDSGLRTASVNWPVTQHAPVDYLIPEIWAIQPEHDQEKVLSSISENVRHIVEKNLHLRDYRSYPQMDEFAQGCVLDILKEYQPDVMFIHQVQLDHERHEHGIHGEHIQAALRLHDQWIQQVITLLKEQGTFEDTMFIILGDHGQLDVKQNICLNTLLQQEGLIQIDEHRNILETKAYVQSAGISAHVYVQDPQCLLQVQRILEDCQKQGYVKHIFTAAEVKQQHLQHDFAFVIEAEEGYAFSNMIHDQLLEKLDNSDYKTGAATHGHLPERGDCPPFIIHNSGRESCEIEGGRLIDEAATILDLLQMQEKSMTGKSLIK